jgi:hypothetical protein
MHFSAGKMFEPSAKWLNDLNAMLGEWKRRQRGGGGPGAELYDGDLIRVRNKSGAARGRFAIIGLDEPPFDLDEENGTLATFQRSPVMDGIEPAFPAHVGRYAVMLEPTANNEIGVGLVGGCVVVQLQAIWNSDKWAEIYEVGDALDDTTDRNDKYRLVSRDFGSAEILWREPDGEGDVDGEPRDKWALIRVGQLGTPIRAFELKTGLAKGSSATAYIRRWGPAGGGTWETTEEEFTVHGSDIRTFHGEGPSEEDGLLGEKGDARYHYESGKWYVVQMQCTEDRDEAPEE